MNGKLRMRQALSGQAPDRVPVGFFYNCDYKARCARSTPQAYLFGTNEDRFQAMASTFRRHGEDWIHADPGINLSWQRGHRLVWEAETALVEDLGSGQRDRIGLDLTLESARGRSHGPGLEFGYSYIRLNRPLESIRRPADLRQASVRSADELLCEGYLDPPRRLVEAFGHEAFITLPMSNLFFNSVFVFGIEEGLLMTVTDRPMLEELLDLNTAQELEVVRAAARVGLDGVWLAEMLVSPDLVSPRIFGESIVPRHRRLVDEAHGLGLKAMAYLTGDCVPLLPAARTVGYDGVVTETQDKRGRHIDVADVRRALGPEICVFGNLDPVDHLIQADDGEMRREIRRQIAAAGRDGAFVMSSNIISLPVSETRIDAVVDYVRRIGDYPLDLEDER